MAILDDTNSTFTSSFLYALYIQALSVYLELSKTLNAMKFFDFFFIKIKMWVIEFGNHCIN